MRNKLLLIFGKIGKVEAAKQIGISYPTLIKKFENTKLFTFEEDEKINVIYNELCE